MLGIFYQLLIGTCYSAPKDFLKALGQISEYNDYKNPDYLLRGTNSTAGIHLDNAQKMITLNLPHLRRFLFSYYENFQLLGIGGLRSSSS